MELAIWPKNGHGYCIFPKFTHRTQNFGFIKRIKLNIQKDKTELLILKNRFFQGLHRVEPALMTNCM